MRIVFITIPGDAKREFANLLHRATGASLSLTIVQQKPSLSVVKRMSTLLEPGLLSRMYYGGLLRLNPDVRKALTYFRLRSVKDTEQSWLAPTITVADVNGDAVYDRLVALQPDLLVVWGSTILSPRIIETAKTAINLHMGIAPQYRGAAANQYAVYKDDFEHLGATVHYINGRADGGDIIERIYATSSLPIPELFSDLNDRAEIAFLKIASSLASGQPLAREEQPEGVGENFKLKDWTPKLRFDVGSKLLSRQRNQG